MSVDLSKFETEIRIYERSRNHVDEYMYLSVVAMLKETVVEQSSLNICCLCISESRTVCE